MKFSPSRSVEDEICIEAIPKKLDFGDDDPERKLSDFCLKSHSSPVAKAEQNPCSPCGASLTNGHTHRLPSVHDRKDSPDDISEVSDRVEAVSEREKEMRTERGEAATLPTLNEDDDTSSKNSETKESGGFSDSEMT